MIKKLIFIFSVFSITLLSSDTLNKQNDLTQYRLNQLEISNTTLKTSNTLLKEQNIILQTKIESIQDNYTQQTKNYTTILENTHSLYDSQLTTFTSTLWLLGVILLILSIIGYNNIKKYIENKIDEIVLSKSNKAIKELEEKTILLDEKLLKANEKLTLMMEKDSSKQTENDRKILDMITQELETKKDKTADDFFYIGLEHQNNNEPEKAITSYKKAIEINSKYYNPYFNMGIAYDNKKEYDNAIGSYKKAMVKRL